MFIRSGQADAYSRTGSLFAWHALGFSLMLGLASPAIARAQDVIASPAATSNELGDLEHKIAAVCDRARSAVVRVDGKQGRASGGGVAVIVSEDGLVLLPAGLKRMELTFRLDDGRKVGGKVLGWSDEYGVAMARLDDDGPWPHVELASGRRPLLGQAVVTFTVPVSESRTTVPYPLLTVTWVDRSAPGQWFMTPGIKVPTHWHLSVVAFDLDGQLVGVMGKHWSDAAQVFTDTGVVQSVFNNLIAGSNVDRLRLAGASDDVPSPRTDTRDAEPPSQAIKEAVLAASVQIRREPKQKGWSGTIITADGLIATCAHHFVMPGKKVTVSLPDGRDLAGEVLGINLVCDIGLVKILEPGSYPHVELGDSLRLQPGASCSFVGFGPLNNTARQALLRTSSVVSDKDGLWSHLLCTDPKVLFVGGDSGGGVFDAEGRLVAIHTGLGGESPTGIMPHTNPRAELFHKHGDELRAGLPRTDESPLAPIEARLMVAAESVLHSVVQVHEGDRCVAVGTIVSPDGMIVTKASLLGEKLACVLTDGRSFPARVQMLHRELDVAVLKIDATALPPIVWAKQDDPAVGLALAIVCGGRSIAPGFVSHPMLSIPRERGSLGARILDVDEGVQVAEVYKFAAGPEFVSFGPQLLQVRDIVLSVNDQPVRTVADLNAVLKTDQESPVGISGDPVRLGIKRNGELVEIRQLLRPPSWPRGVGQSPRRSGFPRAVSIAALTDGGLCGGPVINDEGQAVGLAIAWRETGWLCALPASELARILPK